MSTKELLKQANDKKPVEFTKEFKNMIDETVQEKLKENKMKNYKDLVEAKKSKTLFDTDVAYDYRLSNVAYGFLTDDQGYFMGAHTDDYSQFQWVVYKYDEDGDSYEDISSHDELKSACKKAKISYPGKKEISKFLTHVGL